MFKSLDIRGQMEVVGSDGKHVGILCVPGTVSGGKVIGHPLLKMDGQAVFKLAVGVLEDAARDLGVPLYLLYDRSGTPNVLPQILTQSEVLDAVGKI